MTQINSRSLLSGRVSREGMGYQKTERIEEREGSKVWEQKILHKLCLLSSKLIKNTVSYILFPGENGQSCDGEAQPTWSPGKKT